MKHISVVNETKRLTNFLSRSFRKETYTTALIAVSGGVDSATSLALTAKALGSNNVHCVMLPYGHLNDEATIDAKQLFDHFSIPKKNRIEIDIAPSVDAFCGWDTRIDEARRGNVMARMRMVALYDLSKKMNALVVGTENRTEHLLGYYTRFGDAASDVEPIRHLYKTQVYELAKYLKIPKNILTKSPTAGLWEGQTDEGEFGFTYNSVDEVLYLYFDRHLTKSQIIQKGYDIGLIDRIWWWVTKGVFKERMPLVP